MITYNLKFTLRPTSQSKSRQTALRLCKLQDNLQHFLHLPSHLLQQKLNYFMNIILQRMIILTDEYELGILEEQVK